MGGFWFSEQTVVPVPVPRNQKYFRQNSYEIIGQPLGNFIIKWDWGLINSTIYKVKQKKVSVRLREIKYELPWGKKGFLNITVSPFISDTDEMIGFFLFCDDITEKMLMKDVVSEYKKIESVGQLAAYIAHQISPSEDNTGKEEIPYLKDTCTNLRILLDKCKQLFGESNYKYIQNSRPLYNSVVLPKIHGFQPSYLV